MRGMHKTGAEVYRELQRRGLHLRSGNGRDNQLYSQLKQKLGCPSRQGLLRFLDRSEITASSLLAAMLEIAEPFSLMYRDIFTLMQRYSSQRASESIRLRYTTPHGTRLTLDLSAFIRWMRRRRTVRTLVQERLWSPDDLGGVFRFLRDLSGATGPQDYAPGVGYQVSPPVPTGIPELDDCLRIVHALLSEIALEIEARHLERKRHHARPLSGAKQPGTAVPASRPLGSAMFRDFGVVNLEDRSLEESITEAWFKDLLLPYTGLVRSMQAGNWNREGASQAVETFTRLLDRLPRRSREASARVDEMIQYLELPCWKYRWYLYEVWTTLITVDALAPYRIELALKRGKLLSLWRGRQSIVGRFLAAGGRHCVLLAQQRTELHGVISRKHIAPDLRVALEPGSRPEDTLALIECKQRLSMRGPELHRNISDYEQGTPCSVRNFFVNHDDFTGEPLRLGKTLLLRRFQPQDQRKVARFQRALRGALVRQGLCPRPPPISVLLLDASQSMAEAYGDPLLERRLLELAARNPGVKIFAFNSTLLPPTFLPKRGLCDTIRKKAWGSTRFGLALQELVRRISLEEDSDPVRILVLTDRDYSDNGSKQLSARDSARLKVEEVTPAELMADRGFIE